MGLREGWTYQTLLRVFNTCKYDIGIVASNGQGMNVPHDNGMIMITIGDILMIEANHPNAAFFSSGKLLIVDEMNRPVKLEDLGGYTIMNGIPPHFSDDEIKEHLKGTAKKIEEWINEIDDRAELEAIFVVAKEMDLPKSKIDVLAKKMPEKEWIKNPLFD